MKTQMRSALGAGLLLLTVVAPAMAQRGQHGRNVGGSSSERRRGPGLDFRGGPPRGPSPGLKGDLGRLWMGIGRLSESKTPLTKKQAAKIVGLVRPWAKKPVLTEANAKPLAATIKAVLTTAQITAVTQRPHFGPPGGERDGHRGPGEGRGGPRPDGPPPGFPEDGPPGGPPPEGFGRPPGFGGPDDAGPDGHGPPQRHGVRGNDDRTPPTEEERKAMKTFFDNYNPFYAPTGYKQWKKLPPPLQDDLNRRYRKHQSILEAVSRIAK